MYSALKISSVTVHFSFVPCKTVKKLARNVALHGLLLVCRCVHAYDDMCMLPPVAHVIEPKTEIANQLHEVGKYFYKNIYTVCAAWVVECDASMTAPYWRGTRACAQTSSR
jgi:hypothetical protein